MPGSRSWKFIVITLSALQFAQVVGHPRQICHALLDTASRETPAEFDNYLSLSSPSGSRARGALVCAITKWGDYEPLSLRIFANGREAGDLPLNELKEVLRLIRGMINKKKSDTLFVTHGDTVKELQVLVGREIARTLIIRRSRRIGVKTKQSLDELLGSDDPIDHPLVMNFNKQALYFLLGMDMADYLLHGGHCYTTTRGQSMSNIWPLCMIGTGLRSPHSFPMSKSS